MAAKRWDGAAWTAFTAGVRRRWDGANWIDLTFGRRWNGSQWIELWGANEGNPADLGGGTYFVFNDDETVVAFTDSGVDTFNLTNTIQGF